MRLLTAEVSEALWWFEQTHELVSNGFGAFWRLAWLPGPGSVGEQDAWLWEALRTVREEHTRELHTRVAAKADELARWRARKRRELT